LDLASFRESEQISVFMEFAKAFAVLTGNQIVAAKPWKPLSGKAWKVSEKRSETLD
jgi:hypothetical protein